METFDKKTWLQQAKVISRVLENAEEFNKDYLLPPEEFALRQKKTIEMLKREGYDCGILYSDEHYCGDVPYLAGNCNITVEPVAAVISPKGLYFIAGLESGVVAEQFCRRSNAHIRKVDILNVDGETYPSELLRPENIIEEACGGKPKKAALLTTRSVFPLGLYNVIKRYVGEENLKDISVEYYRVKYEKSDREMRLIAESSRIADYMLEGMLRILKPGIRETQAAQWGYVVAKELGADALGFDVMVTAGKNNRTMVARATNAIIKEGDVVHIGASPKRDGLCGAERASVICASDPAKIPDFFIIWTNFLREAFEYAKNVFEEIAEKDLPGCEHEKRMIEFYDKKAPELERKLGISLPNFSRLKGYVTSHNSGYTECQEFYGALSPQFNERCARQMVIMMDVCVKGFIDSWDDIAIKGLDYLVVEKTLGKFGKRVEILNKLPVDLQYLVGECF